VTEMTKRDSTVVHYLNEAYANERRLELALASHADATTRPEYAKRLRDHLRETQDHATKIERRIRGLGGTPETVSIPGPEGLVGKLESAQGIVQRATAAVQHSLHTVRRTGEQELMLENARTEFREEAQEIAIYRALESIARAVGDSETARLAREILREEERMSSYLGDLIPELAMDVVHDAVPVSEIEGPAARRTSADGAGRAASRSSNGASATRGGSTRRARRARSATRRTARVAARASARTASRAGTATSRTTSSRRRAGSTRPARRASRSAARRTARPRARAGGTTRARGATGSRGAAGRTSAARRAGTRSRASGRARTAGSARSRSASRPRAARSARR
jgi:ferritin-like metal-binding protein YciE